MATRPVMEMATRPETGMAVRHHDALVAPAEARQAAPGRLLDEDHELDASAHRRAALLAGVLVVAFFERARALLELGMEHLVVALWRPLKLE